MLSPSTYKNYFFSLNILFFKETALLKLQRNIYVTRSDDWSTDETILVPHPKHPCCLPAPAWMVRSTPKGAVMHTGHPVVPSFAGTISYLQLRHSLAPSRGTPR